MNRWHRLSRVVLTLIAAAVVASVSVSAAEAGGYCRGRGYGNARYSSRGYASVRYRGGYARPMYSSRVVVSRPVYYGRPVYYRPAYGMYRVGRPVSGGYLAFSTGGLSFGFALSSAPRGYYYMDPYCNQRFASLGAYRDHCAMHHHEVVVRVIHENAPDRVYQDYDNGPDWNGDSYDTPRKDWNDRGYQRDWNDNDNDSHDENWNDGKDQRRDWNDSGDDDDEGDGR